MVNHKPIRLIVSNYRFLVRSGLISGCLLVLLQFATHINGEWRMLEASLHYGLQPSAYYSVIIRVGVRMIEKIGVGMDTCHYNITLLMSKNEIHLEHLS